MLIYNQGRKIKIKLWLGCVIVVMLAIVPLLFFAASRPASTSNREGQSIEGPSQRRALSLLGGKSTRIQPDARDEESRSNQLTGHDDSLPSEVLGSDGRLSYFSIRRLGLTRSQAIEVTRLLDGFKESMATLILEHLSIAAEPQDGVTYFRIRSFGPDSLLDELQIAMANSIGLPRSQEIIAALLHKQEYPEWGKYDVVLSLRDSTHGPAAVHIDFDLYDADGKRVGGGQRAIDSRDGIFRDYTGIFGSVFPITDPNAPFVPNLLEEVQSNTDSVEETGE